MRALPLVLVFAAACGSEPTPPSTDPLIPVAIGNHWKYRVTSATGVVSDKIQTITATVTGGYRFETTRGTTGTKETLSVQRIENGQLIRLEEEGYKNDVLQERYRYEPSSLRADSNHLTSGETYETTHTKIALDARDNVLVRTTVQHRFTVVSGAELVEVPAGRFTAVHLKREDLADHDIKEFWYVQGLGKVKETGGQTEELVEYQLAP